MTNSRQKGKRGELEFAALLRQYGHEARRGQQFCGSPDSPDVVSDIDYHVEVKRVERLNLWAAIEQARADAGDKPWLVAHRKNQERWVVILDAEEFLRLVSAGG